MFLFCLFPVKRLVGGADKDNPRAGRGLYVRPPVGGHPQYREKESHQKMSHAEGVQREAQRIPLAWHTSRIGYEVPCEV